ncbi:MAG TPA: cyanophycin synthetase [Thermoanaerobaculia bacterium]|nr:cyanophycin synthetase [Thermoanaerobaculia bacterium]HUM30935.1 cyanophycin synthetase [Thermoanaerobaculia bacterium]HXK69268.1 cyanophycin synthetase [Thermoanaerobaculia bacterium]
MNPDTDALPNPADLKVFESYEIAPGPLTVRDIRIMQGANYFSGGAVVIFRIDLGEYDEVFTGEIAGFHDELSKRLPSLKEHHCSVGEPGGFLLRVKEGTLLGHVTEHVAIELQTLAGMDAGYGKTRSTSEQGVYNVVFRFLDEAAGVYAGKAAVNLVNAILKGEDFPVSPVIEALVQIRERRLLGPSTQAIVDAAAEREIPFLRLDQYNLVQLGTGRYRKWIRATLTSDTSLIAVETADDKELTLSILKDAGIPVPATVEVLEPGRLPALLNELGGSITLKPRRGHRGEGVTTSISDPDELPAAFEAASSIDPRVLAQTHVPGSTYRFLVMDYQLTAAVKLAPPVITGDGSKTVAELVEALNQEPGRGPGDKDLLSTVTLDIETLRILKRAGVHQGTVLPEGQTLRLKTSGSLSLGGSAEDVTDTVHPMNRFLAERACRALGLNVAGVDVIAKDCSQSILETEGAVIEVNAAPDFRMHLNPTRGESRPVAKALVSMLFPAGTPTRVPVYSVTGTLGKTICVNLLAHCLTKAGHICGVTSTEGLFIDGRRIMKGDLTYPEQVALVLKDPTITCAVLETSREGILRRGLGYTFADAGIILNMFDDHVGRDDIRYLEDLAYAKSVVAEQVYGDGVAVLSADHELVTEMAKRVYTPLIYFSSNDQNPVLRQHVRDGGIGIAVDRDQIVILDSRDRHLFLRLDEIPLTFHGRAALTLDSILGALSALYGKGIPLDSLRESFATFFPTPEVIPGRLNLLQMGTTTLLLDYAHNAAGFRALHPFVKSFQKRAIGILDAAGDRSDEEILNLGRIAAETYNALVLYEGYDRRGREEGEILQLLKEGALTGGISPECLHAVPEPEEAWQMGLSLAQPDELVVLLSPRPESTMAFLLEEASRRGVKLTPGVVSWINTR